MICHVVRFQNEESIEWGVVHEEQVYAIGFQGSSAEFLKDGRALAYDNLRALQQGSNNGSGVSIDELEILSPITVGARVLCQGANYRQHMIDSGMDPDAKNFNMFFNKSSASICAANDNVIKPRFVKLLDYEVELGLVIGSELDQFKEFTPDNIHELVAGVVIGNDVSARDIQIPQMQFFKGKSYRTFCPLGPILCLLEAEDMHYLHDLELELRVNDNVRQKDSTENLVFKPEESLTEFSQVSAFSAGDVVLTGTPSGCALSIPSSGLLRTIVQLLPEDKKWKMFIKSQLQKPNYMQPGDVMSATIKSRDGKVNLGRQVNKVVSE